MKNIFLKINKPLLYLLLIILAFLLFLIGNYLHNNNLSSLFINLSAGILGSLFTLFFLDNYFLAHTKLNKKGLKILFKSDMESVVYMSIIALAQVLVLDINNYLNKDMFIDKKETTLPQILTKAKEKLDLMTINHWTLANLNNWAKDLENIKNKVGNLKNHYNYGVIEDSFLLDLLNFEGLCKKPPALLIVENGLINKIPSNRYAELNNFIKEDLYNIISLLEKIIHEIFMKE